MSIADKVAVVTGGSSGIGQAIALRLAAQGLRVANLDIADGGQTQQQAALGGGKVRSYHCDLTQPDDIRRSLSEVLCNFGPATVLVHAAAALFLAPFERLSAAQWQRSQAVSVDAAFHLVQAVLPGMRSAGWGRIVLITSSTLWVGGQAMAHYIANKGGLMGLAHGLSFELGADNITVNCVAPGLTRTAKVEADMPEAFFQQIAQNQSIKRNGLPQDHAAAVSFLCSEEASFITGQTLLVDGGQVLT